jgi:predicted nucleotidyltransferase
MQRIENLIHEFAERPEVESIALGGSRAVNLHDDKSDYDVYIYLNRELDPLIRKDILSRFCSYMEIDNQYWENEDDCVLSSGPVIELLYRRLDDFAASVSRVVDDAQASNGYTTCMWDNLLHSEILYDRAGALTNLQNKYNIKYPQRLRQNILDKNTRLLDGYIPSYFDQIVKASERMDIVSVNHRITEFLASYFDILFAYNEVTHPGEKRLIAQAKALCKKLPDHFEEDVNMILRHSYEMDLLIEALVSSIRNLKRMLH